jgi:hypothetical protein
MKYTALLTDEAQANAQSIYDWLLERSAQGATNWFKALLAGMAEIELQPDAFPLATESFLAANFVREHYFKTRHGRVYRLLFTIKGSEVHVIYVRGPGQALIERRALACILHQLKRKTGRGNVPRPVSLEH